MYPCCYFSFAAILHTELSNKLQAGCNLHFVILLRIMLLRTAKEVHH